MDQDSESKNLSGGLTDGNNSISELSRIAFEPIVWDWATVIQAILATTGILGNSLVICVYRRMQEMKQNTTNTFIAALATADLITSFSMIPHRQLSGVPQNAIGNLYCKIIWSNNIRWISTVASIINLTMLAVERYIAVSFPSRYKQIFTTTKTKLIIMAIWVFAFAFNTFCYYNVFVVDGQCFHIPPRLGFHKFLGCAIFIIEYLMPVITMLAANIRTIQLIQIQARLTCKTDNKNKTSSALNRARRRVVNMLFIVIIAFIVCWSPDQFAFLAFYLGWVSYEYAYGLLYDAFAELAFANSCVNPIIYTLMNRNFREALAQQLSIGRQPQEGVQRLTRGL